MGKTRKRVSKKRARSKLRSKKGGRCCKYEDYNLAKPNDKHCWSPNDPTRGIQGGPPLLLGTGEWSSKASEHGPIGINMGNNIIMKVRFNNHFWKHVDDVEGLYCYAKAPLFAWLRTNLPKMSIGYNGQLVDLESTATAVATAAAAGGVVGGAAGGVGDVIVDTDNFIKAKPMATPGNYKAFRTILHYFGTMKPPGAPDEMFEAVMLVEQDLYKIAFVDNKTGGKQNSQVNIRMIGIYRLDSVENGYLGAVVYPEYPKLSALNYEKRTEIVPQALQTAMALTAAAAPGGGGALAAGGGGGALAAGSADDKITNLEKAITDMAYYGYTSGQPPNTPSEVMMDNAQGRLNELKGKVVESNLLAASDATDIPTLHTAIYNAQKYKNIVDKAVLANAEEKLKTLEHQGAKILRMYRHAKEASRLKAEEEAEKAAAVATAARAASFQVAPPPPPPVAKPAAAAGASSSSSVALGASAGAGKKQKKRKSDVFVPPKTMTPEELAKEKKELRQRQNREKAAKEKLKADRAEAKTVREAKKEGKTAEYTKQANKQGSRGSGGHAGPGGKRITRKRRRIRQRRKHTRRPRHNRRRRTRRVKR